MLMEIKKLAGSQVEIKSEIAAPEFEHFFEHAIAEAQKTLELPGFRKGTAPRERVLAHLGEDHILWEAARDAINEHWPHIIEESHLEPVGKPAITITKIAKGNPLGFTIVIATLEKVTLPDYRAVAQEVLAQKESITVGDEEIKKTFEAIKTHIEKDPAHPYRPLFEKANLEDPATRELIRQNIYGEKELRARDKKRIAMLDAIVQKTAFSLPDVIVDREVELMLRELKESVERMALTWSAYLDHVKKTEEDLEKEWRPEAERRAKFGIVLREIARAENLVPNQKILDERAEQFIRSLSEEERKTVSIENLKDTLAGRMQHEMVFDVLENNKK